MKSKTELREFYLNKRRLLSQKGVTEVNSSVIINKILLSDDFIKARHIGLYFPVKGEVDLLKLLNIKEKLFYFPKCVGDNLSFVKFSSFDGLKKDIYNIPIPIGESVLPDILDLIYVPCLAANASCYRLGYGKGYYDRFFSKYHPRAKKIIVAQSCFISDDFVQEKFDFKCDMVLSEL